MLLAAVALPAQEPQAAKEAALVAHLVKEVRQSTTALDKPDVQSYVDRLGKRLAAQFTGDSIITYTFAVVTDSLTGRTHEPMALPGGYIFLSTSLLLAAQDEAELAGMLAHAMSHIADHDSSRVAGRSQVVNQGDVPLIFLEGGAVRTKTSMRFR